MADNKTHIYDCTYLFYDDLKKRKTDFDLAINAVAVGYSGQSVMVDNNCILASDSDGVSRSYSISNYEQVINDFLYNINDGLKINYITLVEIVKCSFYKNNNNFYVYIQFQLHFAVDEFNYKIKQILKRIGY